MLAGWLFGLAGAGNEIADRSENENRLHDLLLILFGWLLGLLGPKVIDAIAKGYRRKEIRRSLFAELGEIRVRLAQTSAFIAMRNGTITRKLLEWTMPIVNGYKGFYADPKNSENLEKALGMTDEQLKATYAVLRQRSPSRALTLKKFTAPFLVAHLTSLHLFPIAFEQRVREFAARFATINEDIDEAWFFFEKTFDTSLGAENLALVKSNQEDAYTLIGQRCKDLADMIGQLMEEAD